MVVALITYQTVSESVTTITAFIKVTVKCNENDINNSVIHIDVRMVVNCHFL